MKSIIRILLTINIFGFIYFGCGSKEEPKSEETQTKQSEAIHLSIESIKQIKLETEIVSLQPFEGNLIIPAKIIANQDNEAQIGSLVKGRVSEVLVRIGDYVKAGQILMYVEGLEIGEIKSGYLKSKANFEFSKADYERHKSLLDQNIGSKQSFYEAESEFQKMSAEFQAEDKKIHSIGLSDEEALNGKNNSNDEHISGKLAIKSPINGTVIDRNVVIGQLVDETTTGFKIINTNSLWIDGQIYEKDLPKINQKINVNFSTTTYPDETFSGRIIYIGQIVNEQTRTITIRGEFANLTNKLKLQMFGELKIPVGANAKVFMISDEAVVKESGMEYVFVQISDTTFEQRKILTGTSFNNRIEIREGLKAGEKVVSKGVFYLKSELKKEELGGD